MPTKPDREQKQIENIDDLILSSLSNPIRKEILLTLYKKPNITYTQLLKELGLDTGTLNYHLTKLEGLITKSESGGYILTEAGNLAIDVLKYLRKKKVFSRKQFAESVNNFLIMKGIEATLMVFSPRKFAKKIVANPLSYLPFGLLILSLTILINFLSHIFSSNTLQLLISLLSNIILLFLLAYFISKSAHIIWNYKHSTKEILSLVLIANYPYLIGSLLSTGIPLLPFYASIYDSITHISFFGVPITLVLSIVYSAILFLWYFLILFFALREYYRLRKIQTFVLLFFAAVVTYIVWFIIVLLGIFLLSPTLLNITVGGG